MKRQWFIVFLALIYSPICLHGQNKLSKSAAAKPAPSIETLVLQGKIAAAVRLAANSPESARTGYRKLLERVDSDITDRKIAAAQSTMTGVSQFLGDYAKTKSAVKLASEPLKGRQLRLQGIQLSDQKEYKKAEGVLRQALVICQQLKDPVLEAGVHNNLGYSLRNQEQLEAASGEFDAARKIAEEQNDNLRASSYNFNLGEVLLQQDRAERSMEAFRRSGDQSKAAARANLEARAILMQGVAQGHIDSLGPSPLGYFERAQKMFEKQGDARNAGWAYYLMANRSAYMQKFADAVALGEKAVPWLIKAKDSRGLKSCYFFLYDMYTKLGEEAKSERYKELSDEISN